MQTAIIKVDSGSPRQAAASFLQALLEHRVVDVLVVPREVGSRRMVVPALVVSPDGLAGASPFAPVALINAARAVSQLTARDPGVRVGAVLRPCEIRALVEMAKLQQVTLEKVLIIGVDCAGTFEPVDYYQLTAKGLDPDAWLVRAAEAGHGAWNGTAVRTACTICRTLVPSGAHLALHWLGFAAAREVGVGWEEGAVDLAPLLEAGVLLSGEPPAGRQPLVESLQQQRQELEEQLCRDFAARASDINHLLDELAPCLRCHNCREVCPICVCRECVFDSNLFEHEPEKFLRWAGTRGALELPTDTLLYHLTRMHHMAVSCVGCGQCESGCPSRIPLTLLFRTNGKKLQGIFDYQPGASTADPPPLTTYREQELEPR
ncbi:MAG TPA: formate dehydrogenase [Desulfotomaculum sp.]|nr:formate dehydrogenase [Desulfotomaculum sp.]